MLPINDSASTSEQFTRLRTMASEIELELPALRGLLPDLDTMAEQISITEDKESTYALGTIKSGKSTLVSALLGNDILPRGSGVKTFNITRISHAAKQQARIIFKTAAQLCNLIRFDLRMLGCLADTPNDPYTLEGIRKLRQIYDAFLREADVDGRLARINRAHDDYNLLQIARTRLGHVVQGLERLASLSEADVIDMIRSHGCLWFKDQAFEQYLDWANVIEFAALIQEIELSIPFPANLAQKQILVDCQGSDSLNPLDFAAVDAALHRADRVLYVVNSRLGLRIADKALIKHLGSGGLADKTLFIHNVEAFEPLSSNEIDAQLARLQSDLATLGFCKIKPIAVCAIYELNRYRSKEDCELIHSLWQRRQCGDVLSRLEQEFSHLRTTLANSNQDNSLASATDQRQIETGATRLINLATRRIRNIVEGILARDLDILGVQSSDIELQEIKNAVNRLVDGEQTNLRQKLDRLAQDAYDRHGPVQIAVDQFLAMPPAERPALQTLPANIEQAYHHAEVITVALERFNTEWIQIDQKIRVEHIHPLIQTGLGEIRESIIHLHKLVPSAIGGQFINAGIDVLPDLRQTLACVDTALDQFYTRTDPPETVAPIVLAPHITSSLAAEFYARRWFGLLRQKLRSKFKPEKASTDHASLEKLVDPNKIKNLWLRTLKAAHKAAIQDQEFSVSSARENLKFLYFHHAIAQALDAFKHALLTGIDAYYNDLERLQSNHSLLLEGEDRRKLRDWLKRLDIQLTPN